MSESLVAVGIGNTTVQCGVAELPAGDGGLVHWVNRFDISTAEFDPRRILETLPDGATAVCVASVHRPSEAMLTRQIQQTTRNGSCRVLKAADLPLRLAVEEPGRVGMDRLVACVAANALRPPGAPAVVVDAGTAITVDLLDVEGVFQGGAILPGVRLVAEALAEKTDLLPEVRLDADNLPPPPVGRSTEAAIRSGLFYGATGGIGELIRGMARECDRPPSIFVTGGDVRQLACYLHPEAIYVDDLVLRGIVLAGSS